VTWPSFHWTMMRHVTLQFWAFSMIRLKPGTLEVLRSVHRRFCINRESLLATSASMGPILDLNVPLSNHRV